MIEKIGRLLVRSERHRILYASDSGRALVQVTHSFWRDARPVEVVAEGNPMDKEVSNC